MHIGALCLYPVKSLGPVALQSAEVGLRGIAGDRRWLIVDEAGRFVTRRELPELARIALNVCEGGYRLTAPQGETFLLSESVSEDGVAPVTVWRDTVDAVVVRNDASRLISEVAGRALRLAYMPDASLRPVNPDFARAGDRVSFADAFPVLIASEASLAALNARLDTPVPMARFRPNIVLAADDLDAWAERDWREVTLGAIRFRLPKACIRCIVITQQPDTGERLEGNAVPSALRKLGQFGPQGALFGMNGIPEARGTITIGDRVTIG